jgi:hypothetical protein
MKTKEEVWKDIPGFEGIYQCSNIGNVKSLDRLIIYSDNRKRLHFGKTLNKHLKIQGYYDVCLIINGYKKYVDIHKLVAICFIPNPENKPCIDHINTIRTDNRVENLRWVTHKENSNNELSKINYRNSKIGFKHTEETKLKMSKYKIKTVLQYDLNNTLINKFESATLASKYYNVNKCNITSSCRKNKKYLNYIWKYEN